MSRIGKQPIQIPENVDLKVEEGRVWVKGPKGELEVPIESSRISVNVKDKNKIIEINRRGSDKKIKAMHGLVRSLIFNAVEGVMNGYKKELELHGVGYRAKMQGKNLVLSVGFSHPVVVEPKEGIEFEVDKNNKKITVLGIDKQKVGQSAAEIRRIRPPEPYKGKGIRYKGEEVKKKPGKAAKTVGIGEK